MKRLLLLFSLLLTALPGPGRAESSAAELLARYQTTFDAELKKLTDKREADLAGLKQQYLASLKKLEATEQAAGNLSALLAIREEIQRFEKENELTEFNLRADSEAVLLRQKFYLQRDGLLRGECARGIDTLTEKLLAAVERLQAEQTRQNQIEEALKTREFRERAEGRPEVKTARELVAILKKAEAEEKAELERAMQMAQAAPPEPLPSPAATVEAPERGERGRDITRIRGRFDDFIKAMQNDNFRQAADIVDPEQSKQLGELILHAYFNAFKPWLKMAKAFDARIEPGKVRVSDDGQTAQNFPSIRWDKREDRNAKPTDWVKRNGEWYIVFKDKPAAPEKPERRR